MVAIYFELCGKNWGVSPATTQIPGGLERTKLMINSESSFNEGCQTDPDDVGNQELVNTSLESVANPNESSSIINSSTFKGRLEQLDIALRTHHQAKVRNKLPPKCTVDSNCYGRTRAKEENAQANGNV